MSALAAHWLARPDSRVMALIGCGAQAEFQALGFHRLCGIRELRLFDTDPQAIAKLERNLRAMPELRGIHCEAMQPRDDCEATEAAVDVPFRGVFLHRSFPDLWPESGTRLLPLNPQNRSLRSLVFQAMARSRYNAQNRIPTAPC